VKAAEALYRQEQRRRRLVEEISATEDACGEVGEQLAALRRKRAELELELASLDRALDALRRDEDPPGEATH
jgi:septal ring factor EnvC (AmiA/AmiB activator)